MDATNYECMAIDILSDKNNYIKIDAVCGDQTFQKMKNMINKFTGQITEKEYEYLTEFVCRQSNFYGLPKIHKSRTINEKCSTSKSLFISLPHPSDLKLRPIIAGPTCPTHRLSNFIDILLKPYIKHVKSYVRDTMDFLYQLPTEIEENSILVSFDVTSLYSNIPHELGLKSISFWLDRFPYELPERISKSFVMKKVEFILQNNTFYFDGDTYRQVKGTAMGTKMAPTYATLVMAYLEEILYNEVMLQFGEAFASYFKNAWRRFLDDCFIIWTLTSDDLEVFPNMLNKMDVHIQFTMESSDTKLPFLDTLIIKSRCKLETDIYYKPTDTQQYLMFTSCHPSHTKRSLPYNLARRIRTIVSNTETQTLRFDELRSFLRKRKYPEKLIQDSIEKSKSLAREDLLKVKDKTTSEVKPIAFVSTFNPKNPDIMKTIRNNIPILESDARMKNVLDSLEIINSKRQSKNLKQMLTRARFTSISTPPPTYEVKKCLRGNCATCDYLLEGHAIEFKGHGAFHVFILIHSFSSTMTL